MEIVVSPTYQTVTVEGAENVVVSGDVEVVQTDDSAEVVVSPVYQDVEVQAGASLTIAGGVDVIEAGIQGPAGPAGATGPTGPQGPQGDPGDMHWEGTWAVGTAYTTDALVEHEGSTWVSLQPTTGNEPGTAPLYWQLVAAKGEAGAQGPQGESGVASRVTHVQTVPEIYWEILHNLVPEPTVTVKADDADGHLIFGSVHYLSGRVIIRWGLPTTGTAYLL